MRNVYRVTCKRSGDPDELAHLVGDYEDLGDARQDAQSIANQRVTWQVFVTQGTEIEQEIVEDPGSLEHRMVKAPHRWEPSGESLIIGPNNIAAGEAGETD